MSEGLATRAIHAGQGPDTATGATITPIYLTSTYTQAGIGHDHPYEYSRTGNPTRTALETCLAALEGGAHGLAFASGSAATAAVLSTLRPGDHVLAGDDLYGGTYRLFETVWRPLGVEFTYVDARDPGAFERAARPSTRVFWLETPSNPLLRLVVDNTFATPVFQQPLALGAHVVVHSTTKYLGGHSDVIGGAVITDDDEFHERLKAYQNSAGAVPGAFDAWLVLRGLKTLTVRMQRHAENGARVAAFLAQHPRVHDVVYPGLPTYPQRDLAGRQMSGHGGMVTLALPGGHREVDDFVRALRLFSFAESLGGVESLVCHPETMTHAAIPAEERRRRGITPGTVRLSVGIEDAEDLVADLEQALEAPGHG